MHWSAQSRRGCCAADHGTADASGSFGGVGLARKKKKKKKKNTWRVSWLL
eukprot:NODE_13293_length_246_cov_36.151832.p2 GENE.NODE_13293_length_246_cov_36.151832~~NODE_13293_length_246_cov_36.151832.p2  ORF type:complete len:50 (-),score=28.41 NODE_13293_length_246_cov_36.151832:28-177(-)